MCSKCGNSRRPQTHLKENLIGKTFGKLTVIKPQNEKWLCQCSCGNTTLVSRSELTRKDGKATISCGCSRLIFKVGDVINNRKIIALKGTDEHSYSYGHYYRVKCLLCNREYDSLSTGLLNGKSCGCIQSIGNKKIQELLQQNNIPYKVEYIFKELPKKRFDFCILDKYYTTPIRLIEFDGEQHFLENVKNSGWNTIEHYNKVIESDKQKNDFAIKMKIPLVRTPYWERYNLNLEMILGDIYLIPKIKYYEKEDSL